MLTLILKNPKAVIIFITALVVPMVMSSLGFIMTTSATNAKVPMHEARIVQLEQLNYRMDERYAFIQKALEVIQDRELKELKEAKQERLAKKQE